MPNHKMTDEYLIETFYRALNSLTKTIMDNATGGDFMELTFTKVVEMLERITKTSRACHTRDVVVTRNTGSSVISAEQRRRKEKHNQDMAHMKTQMDLLMKYFLSRNIEKLKAVGSYSEGAESNTEEDADYLHN